MKAVMIARLITWILIIAGGVEAVWGLRQLYGYAQSNHYLYSLTGSFFNPGPYSGYLAMVFPLCLHVWLTLNKNAKRTKIEHVEYYLAAGVGLLIICTLPSGMSRSAWLAASISGVWVYGVHASWGARFKTFAARYRKQTFLFLALGVIALISIGYVLFQMKAASAHGRLFLWKISSLAIAEKPMTGHGVGSFASAYGMAQENYFARGNYSETEEWVAGSPEYAFNEYLQVAVEHGIPFLLLILFVIAFCLWRGIKEKRIGVCGGAISILIFAFSSYPMQIPMFAYSFFFLLAACVVGKSKWSYLYFISLLILTGVYYFGHKPAGDSRQWERAHMYYNVGSYQSAKEEYESLYPELKDQGAFLFEYGHCLHKLQEYERSMVILKEAMEHSNDPMILNIIGKNYQVMGEYEKAEESFAQSTHRLPGRIYPYYLLAKLYAEPAYYYPEKLKQAGNVVLTKEPKVESTAIKEMREELKKILNNKTK